MKTTDIPQASSLARIRLVVEAVANGAETRKQVGLFTGISPRHVNYAVHGGRILGWLVDDEQSLSITTRGRALLRAAPGSTREVTQFRESIRQSRLIERIAPSLLEPPGPSLELLTSRISALTDLASSTARRRAETLLAWRDQAHLGELFPPPVVAEEESSYEPRSSASIQLTRVSLSNFGPIRNATAELGAFTVAIGRNAAGKSTFLDGIAFLSDSLRHGVAHAIRSRATTLEELLWFGQRDRFSVALDFFIPADLQRTSSQDAARYELEIGRLEDGSTGILTEQLFIKPSKSQGNGQPITENPPSGWKKVLSNSSKGNAWYGSERTSWKTIFWLGNQKLALSSVPEDPTKFPMTIRLRAFLERGVQKLALHAASMSKPCSPLSGREFLPDGSNLPLVLRQLQEEDEERYLEWTEHLQEALPDVEAVGVVEREEDRHLYLKVRYRGGFELPAWRLSEGSLRAIALTLIPFAVERDAIYLIEEPENGIHPQAVEAIHQTLAWPFGIQVLVATHSPVFISIVEPQQILCFTKEAGATKIISGKDHPALAEWKEELDLGTLFASSVLV